MESQLVPTSPSSSRRSSSSTDSDTILVSPPTSPRRDNEFYCRDVIFQVQDILFKVPRRPFEEESDAFKTMFTLPPSDHSSGIEGASDDNPIVLTGILAEEFRALLWVMFRPAYGSSRTLTKDQWTHVLKLSTMWDFDTIRDKSITELGRLVREPVTRVVLARSFSIAGWMEPALISLAQQDTLSADELEHLGWATAAKLMQVRESVVFSGHCACGCNYCTVSHGPVAAPHNALHGGGSRPAVVSPATLRKTYDFSDKIRELFGTELY